MQQLKPLPFAIWDCEMQRIKSSTSPRERASATVMTKDSDFVELQEQLGAPPKLIWVTCGNTSNQRLQTILISQLAQAVALLESGEDLVEITGQ